MIKETLKNIKTLQGLMIAYVTNERNDKQPNEYTELYLDTLVGLKRLHHENPNPYRTLEEFWVFCKSCYEKYAERIAYVNEIYGDVIIDLKLKLKQAPKLKEWEKANQELTDELEPIRKQWKKAKNFLLVPEPDYENCIKEATNSIESALQILLQQPGGALGKIIRSAELDSDIERMISKMYGLVSNKDFVRHGGMIEQKINKDDAEFFLNFAAISIRYIKKKRKNATQQGV